MKKFALIAVATISITTTTAQEDDIQHILSRQLSRYKVSGSRRKKVKEKLEQLKEDTKKPSSSVNWYSQKKIEWWKSPETTTSEDSKADSYKNEWWMNSSEDDWNGSGKSGKSGSSWWQSGSKSNKSTWSDTTWHSGDDWKSHHDKEGFFLVPYICPRKCVEYVPDDTTSSDTSSSSLGNVAVQDCNLYDDHQKWYVGYHEQFMKFEASDEKGSCIGIGDGESVVDVCGGGSSEPPSLKMVDCEDERTDWYFTGGQYIAGYCWIRGYSAAMNVELDGDDVTDECKDFLKVIPDLFPSSPSPSITTFMVVGKKYLDSIPAPTSMPTPNPTPPPTPPPTS